MSEKKLQNMGFTELGKWLTGEGTVEDDIRYLSRVTE